MKPTIIIAVAALTLVFTKTSGMFDSLLYKSKQQPPVLAATLQLPADAEPTLGAAVSLQALPSSYEQGEWSSLISWPHVPSSVAALPDGKLVTWSSNELLSFPDNGSRFSYSSVFDPKDRSLITTNNPTHDMFCAGISLRADGTVVAAGGNPQLQDTSFFNPNNKNWSQGPFMNHERWYGTTLTLADDSVFATFARGDDNIPEILRGSGGWTELPDAAMTTLYNEQTTINSNAKNDSVIAQWNTNMAVAPNGRIFHAGPTRTMHWLDINGSGNIQPLGVRAGNDQHRQGGTFALYGVGKALMTGGSDKSRNPPATATAMTFDITGATPVVRATDSMIAPRVYHNSVVLPNAEVMIIGGNSSGILFDDSTSILETELWSPLTGQFRSSAAIAVPRNYHSVALLMQDGRVFSAGGGLCGKCDENHPDAQIYSPPYLFNSDGSSATRPTISVAPETLMAGNHFLVESSANVASYNLIRLASSTHSVNTDERLIPVSRSPVTTGLDQLQLTANPNVVIPGHYWLFALDSRGVPSEGKTIRVIPGVANLLPPLRVNNVAEQNFYEGQDVNIALQVEGSAIGARYSATGLPQGLQINANSGLISGTVSATAAGQQLLKSEIVARTATQANATTVTWRYGQGGVSAGGQISPGYLFFLLLILVLRMLPVLRSKAIDRCCER